MKVSICILLAVLMWCNGYTQHLDIDTLNVPPQFLDSVENKLSFLIQNTIVKYSKIPVVANVYPLHSSMDEEVKKSDSHFDTLWFGNPNINSRNDGEPCFMLMGDLTVEQKIPLSTKISTIPKMAVSGSVTYDYQYRSRIDTPFYANDLRQHTLSLNMKILYDGRIPANINFRIRKGNQPFYRDMADICLNFKGQEAIGILKRNLMNSIRRKVDSIYHQIPELESKRRQLLALMSNLKTNFSNPSLLQKIVEEREKNLRNTINPSGIKDMLKDTLHYFFDSLESRFVKKVSETGIEAEFNKQKAQYKIYEDEISRLDDSIKHLQSKYQRIVQQLDTKFAHLDKEGLKDLVSTYHIPKDSLPKGIQTLMSIRQLAIGRSILNHSELTAKNIGLSGVNVEFTSDWYGAASVGFIDQQFRDQQLLQNKLPKQWLSLVSVGRGDKEKAAIIFTYFTGKRNLFAQYVTGNTGMQPNNVSGTSIQGIYRLGTQHQFIGEIAKSNYSSLAGIDQSVSKISMSNWLSMKDHQNEAYSIAYNGTYKSTGTGLELSYRKTGRYFQSYSFYNTPSIQESWKFQLDQHIRQWMKLRIGLQKNQFDFPMLTSGFKGDNIFKTAQILIQVKKWPLVMLGYYPSSQITFTDGQVPVESRFNTLNVSLTHSYKAARTYMNSSIVYTRFYNQSTDSSFIYYNTKNLALTQVLYLGNWSLQGSYTKIWQDDRTRLNVCDVQTSCSASEMFSFNAGAKLNNLSGGANNVLGYSAGCTISIKRFAMLQVQYDKSHWPGPSRNLVPVTNGRLTFVKTF